MLTKRSKKVPTLAILKLDKISDYVIFRNYIEVVKKSKKYKDYKILLIGNIEYKNFARFLDGEIVDKFIWINKNNYKKFPFYRAFILNEVNSLKIDVLISPTYSRDLQWVDNIVKSVNIPEKIGSSGDATNMAMSQKIEADSNYTKLIQQSDLPMFEFDRYKEFFEGLLEEKISLSAPKIATKDVDETRLVAFFPSADEFKTCWSIQNFARLAELIKEKYGYKICIMGSKKDKKIARDIIKNSKADLIDMTGKVELKDLPQYLRKMQFIIANDNLGLHLGSAIGVKTVCISNGNFYPRYVNYSNTNMVQVVLPQEVLDNLSDVNYVKNHLLYGSVLDINKIGAEQVFEVLNNLVAGVESVVKKAPVKKKSTATKASSVKRATTAKKVTKAEDEKEITKKSATKSTAKKATVAKKTTTSKTSASKTATKKSTTKATAKKTTTKKATKKGE